jgi:hypothetical protein
MCSSERQGHHTPLPPQTLNPKPLTRILLQMHLLVEKSGWKSEADLKKAEKFAENLEAAVSTRRTEEARHPLMPKMAKKTLEESDGSLSAARHSKQQVAVRGVGVEGASKKAVSAASAASKSGDVGVDGANKVKEKKEEMKAKVQVQMRKEELQRLQVCPQKPPTPKP